MSKYNYILNTYLFDARDLILDTRLASHNSQPKTCNPELVTYDSRLTIHDNSIVSNIVTLFSRLISFISHLSVSHVC